MELRPNVFTQQRQSITITAQVIQSIRLLQFGRDELQDFLRDQAERNPLIEISGSLSEAATAAGDPDRKAPVSGGAAIIRGGAAPSGRSSGTSGVDLDSFCASTVTLRDHLLHQAGLALRDKTDQRIGQEIVEAVDPDGYLRRATDEIADQFGVAEDRVLAVLKIIQTFEPTGIAARDLAECLSLQLADRGRLDPMMAKLLANLPLLAACEIAQLARICRCTPLEVIEMQQEIRSLDPRPGRQFDSEQISPALPDVLVHRDSDGSYRIEMNTAVMPRVLVNREYHARVSTGRLGSGDAQFLTDCMKNANWLVRNLDQRAQTILKIATEIVKRQHAFLEKGPAHLMPLSLKDISVELNIHESTVCRAVSNKYMMTQRGMIPLRSFFTNALMSTDGDDEVSVQRVRQMIRQMIEGETPQAVLSDDAIRERLTDQGIDISRRTVAKYRDMLRIPTSQIRRRQRQAASIAAQGELRHAV